MSCPAPRAALSRLSSGRAERRGFEYYRHGTLSLYAVFNTKTGEVLGKTAARHTSAEFVAFLTRIAAGMAITGHPPGGRRQSPASASRASHRT